MSKNASYGESMPLPQNAIKTFLKHIYQYIWLTTPPNETENLTSDGVLG